MDRIDLTTDSTVISTSAECSAVDRTNKGGNSALDKREQPTSFLSKKVTQKNGSRSVVTSMKKANKQNHQIQSSSAVANGIQGQKPKTTLLHSCTQCSYTSPSIKNFRQHIARTHSGKTTIKHRKRLDAIARETFSIRCQYCKFRTHATKVQTMLKHVSRVHPTGHLEQTIWKYYPCQHCSFRSISFNSLKGHYYVYHNSSLNALNYQNIDIFPQISRSYRKHVTHKPHKLKETHKSPNLSGESIISEAMLSGQRNIHAKSHDSKEFNKRDAMELSVRARENFKQNRPTSSNSDVDKSISALADRQHSCPKCSFMSPTSKGVTIHTTRKHGKENQQVNRQNCTQCSFSSSSIIGLSDHMFREHHMQDQKVEPPFSVIVNTEPSLITEASEQHSCGQCSFSSPSKKGITIHTSRKHQIHTNVPKSKVKKSSSPAHLDEKKIDVKRTDLCIQETKMSLKSVLTTKNNKTFHKNSLPSFSSLKTVKKRTIPKQSLDSIVHPLDSLASDQNDDATPFSCEICFFKGRTQHSVNAHIWQIHGKQKNHKKNFFIRCPHCTFQTSGNLLSTMRQHVSETHSSMKLDSRDWNFFPCHHCAKRYKTFAYLKQHYRKKHKAPKLNWLNYRNIDLNSKRQQSSLKRKQSVNKPTFSASDNVKNVLNIKLESTIKTTASNPQPNKNGNKSLLNSAAASLTTRNIWDVVSGSDLINFRLMKSQSDTLFRCFYCSFECTLESSLNLHMKNIHLDVLNKTGVDVKRELGAISSATARDLECAGKQRLKCKTCSFSSMIQSEIKNHICYKHISKFDKNVQANEKASTLCKTKQLVDQSRSHVPKIKKKKKKLKHMHCKSCSFTCQSRSLLCKHIWARHKKSSRFILRSETKLKKLRNNNGLQQDRNSLSTTAGVFEHPISSSVSSSKLNFPNLEKTIEMSVADKGALAEHLRHNPLHLTDCNTPQLHKKTALKPGRFQCQICHALFFADGDLDLHIKDLHPSKSNNLNGEKALPRAKDIEVKHGQPKQSTHHSRLQEHVIHKCDQCKFQFSSMTDLSMHVKLKHSKSTDNQVLPEQSSKVAIVSDSTTTAIIESQAVLKCAVCDFKFSSTKALTAHTKLKHTKMLNADIRKIGNKDGKIYRCRICGVQRTSVRGFKVHMCVTGGELLTCIHCQFSTRNQSSYRAHYILCEKFVKRQESNKRRNKKKEFIKVSAVEKRSTQDTPGGPLTTISCPPQQKPFHCCFCPYLSVSFRALICHVEGNHTVQIYRCSHCFTSFNTSSELANHLKSHTTGEGSMLSSIDIMPATFESEILSSTCTESLNQPPDSSASPPKSDQSPALFKQVQKDDDSIKTEKLHPGFQLVDIDVDQDSPMILSSCSVAHESCKSPRITNGYGGVSVCEENLIPSQPLASTAPVTFKPGQSVIEHSDDDDSVVICEETTTEKSQSPFRISDDDDPVIICETGGAGGHTCHMCGEAFFNFNDFELHARIHLPRIKFQDCFDTNPN